MKTYTVEYSWLTPSVSHVQIEAETAEQALAVADAMLAAGELDLSKHRFCGDAASTTMVTGLWEGEQSYSGADLVPTERQLATDRAIADEVAPLALFGWQDIEPAMNMPPPKIPVLVYFTDARRDEQKVHVGHWAKTATGSPIWVCGGLFAHDIGKPTKWKHIGPLPEGV